MGQRLPPQVHIHPRGHSANLKNSLYCNIHEKLEFSSFNSVCLAFKFTFAYRSVILKQFYFDVSRRSHLTTSQPGGHKMSSAIEEYTNHIVLLHAIILNFEIFILEFTFNRLISKRDEQFPEEKLEQTFLQMQTPTNNKCAY